MLEPQFEPLYTADEMRRAEAGHDVDKLMERAGRAVAEEALRRYPDARSFGALAGGGANGGDARIALEVCAPKGARRPRRSTPTSSSTACSALASMASSGRTPLRASRS